MVCSLRRGWRGRLLLLLVLLMLLLLVLLLLVVVVLLRRWRWRGWLQQLLLSEADEVLGRRNSGRNLHTKGVPGVELLGPETDGQPRCSGERGGQSAGAETAVWARTKRQSTPSSSAW
ncbi:hypothetical protein Tdes44962_MAKER02407 [Teratosphaeria destructans]|uniref:Uncharacterized protein n=1 Tax=Teratosphaeria destructans TaxID=418781 RepID=A0A9W7W332_9PEZI|nr:hypothetical protein Tdes44962_MAKER02407 [Teratosphaeria destructans]